MFVMEEDDDNKHLYEVEQEYDNTGKDGFPHQPMANIQIHDTVGNTGKCSLYIMLAIQVIVILILIILLGINGVTLTHLNTVEMCDNTAASTGASLGSTACNCSSSQSLSNKLDLLINMTRNSGNSDWSQAITAQLMTTLSLLQNTTKKVDGIVDYTNFDVQAGQNYTKLLSQIGQMLQGQLSQVSSTAQDTASKVTDIHGFTNDPLVTVQNISDTLLNVLQKTEDNNLNLLTISGSLTNIKDTTVTTAGVTDDILIGVQELLEIQNASALFNSITPVSCSHIKAVLPNSPSGYYHVNSRTIYCNMDTLCNRTGGWMRIGYLDMTDVSQTCPSGLRLLTDTIRGVRACGRLGWNPSCSTPVQFPTNGINYTQICGKIIGYQFGSPDANNINAQHYNIDSYYTDGVSITRGYPREHIWSFMAGYTQRPGASDYICPCSSTSSQSLQSFVGNNYYCESGNPNWGTQVRVYGNDPLWDGQGCSSNESPCCAPPDLPWFFRDFGNATSNLGLELRICGDEGVYNNEDTLIKTYEFYVK